MNISEKMEIIRNSVRYAVEDGMGCMDCLEYNPLTGVDDQGYPVYCPSVSQIEGVTLAIRRVGLTLEEVDDFMLSKGAVEGGRGTQFWHGRIGGCIGPDRFLEFMEELLRSKETE